MHGVDDVRERLDAGGYIFTAGNGGSAAHAAHLASELVTGFGGRFKGVRAISLASNPVVLSALANDLSSSEIFSAQLEVLGTGTDVLVVFTTSGQSANIVRAMEVAASIGAAVVCFGPSALPSSLSGLEIHHIACDGGATPEIQDGHHRLMHQFASRILESQACDAE